MAVSLEAIHLLDEQGAASEVTSHGLVLTGTACSGRCSGWTSGREQGVSGC